jgi:UDP-N-acetylmuramoyl-tripeptide--D-alanyl-D-alanine ligase
VIALTLGEVAEATGGRLDGGADPAAPVSGQVTLDSRAAGPGDLFVALAGERVDGHDFAAGAVAAGAVAVLAARPVGVPAVLVDDPVAALGRLAAAVRERLTGLTVVGITGSVGKTSTKDLIAAVLSVAGATVATQGSFNNEIGLPLTVLRADERTRFLVVEMGARGSGHIGYLSGITKPTIGVVTNIGTAHLGVFGTKQETARAKGELVEALPASGLAVLNADDPLVAAMADRTRARVVLTGDRIEAAERQAGPASGPVEGATVRAESVRLDEAARASFTLITPAGPAPVTLAVHGEHQVANALAAAAVGLEAGLTPAEVAQALSAAGPASHWRMEVRRRADGLVVVNDAYNANPNSVAAALHALAAMAAHERWAVLGEMQELGSRSAEEHRAIGRLVAELKLSGLVTIGEGALPIAEGVGADGPVRVLSATDVDSGLALVQQNVRGTDVVLIKASRALGLERLAAGLLAAG